ncbi:protein translocase subunit SecF [Candidatus Woesearchaeota archaeon]|nr:protein translocase subunit SecF [Candidatus Woesearchaeota archaeon]
MEERENQEEKTEEKHIWKKKFSLKEFYDKNYKKLLLIPFLMLVLAILQIAIQTAVTGDFINKGVSLKGGLTVSIDKIASIIELQNYLRDQFPDADISVRALSSAGTQIGIIIEAADVEADELMQAIQNRLGDLNKDEFSIEVMGSSLGASFFKETFRAVIIAFLFMGIVVFLYFRTPTPSFAVILAAFSDIIVTLAIVNLIGMKISTAGIAAFLMLIGYSVDTDILLSTRVLKRKEGTVLDGILSAMRTGMTMSITTMIAVLVALVFAQSVILKQIMIILFIGLLVDLPNTWIQNAGILRWYLERKKKEYRSEE